MKNLTLLLIFMVGLCMSLTDVTAQGLVKDEKNVIGKPAGMNPKPTDIILADLQKKIDVLSEKMQRSTPNDLASKALMIESMLYRGMMSDLTTTSKTVASAYESNLAVFLIDYPESDEYTAKKTDITLDFYNFIFNN